MEMEHVDFNYKTTDKKEIVKHLLYENAIFDPKDLFSDKTSDESCSVSIITPTQMVSTIFNYSNSPAGHAGIAHLLTSLVYPNNTRDFYLGQRIYLLERVDNLFITATKDGLIVVLPEKNEMTQTQYNLFKDYIDELKKSDYVKAGKQTNIYLANDEMDEFFTLDNIDKKLETLKDNIVEKSLKREECRVDELDFSDCMTEEDFLKRADGYARHFLLTRHLSLMRNQINNSKFNQGR